MILNQSIIISPLLNLCEYIVSVFDLIKKNWLFSIKTEVTKQRRMASINLFDRLPPVVPAINVEAWKSQSNISQKLNRLISHLDAKSSNSELAKTEIFAVKKQLKELRSCQTASMSRYSYEVNATAPHPSKKWS